jgi:LysR family nitrogen assimilation transcriptional regulator
VVLTPAGELFLRHVDGIAATVEAADKALDPFRQGAVEHIVLGASPTPARALTPGILAACESNPKLRVSLAPGLSHLLYEQVLAGEIQGALCYDPAVTGRVRLVPLYSEDLFLIGPPSIVRTADGDVKFSDLGPFKLAQDKRFIHTRHQIDATAADLRVKLNIAREVAQIEPNRKLLTEKGYCTIIPRGLFAEEIARGELQARLIVEPIISRTLCLMLTPKVSEEALQFLMTVVSGIVRQEIKHGVLGWRLPQVRSLFP